MAEPTPVDPPCTCSRHSVCPVHLGLVPLVVERWYVIDKWWTDQPVHTDWRVIERAGVRTTQRCHPGGQWEDYDAG